VGTFRFGPLFYYLVLAITVVMVLFAVNIVRTRTGRAFMAIRDHYISAEIMGINLFRYRILSFGSPPSTPESPGRCSGHSLKYVTSEQFNSDVRELPRDDHHRRSGEHLGAIYGAVFMILLPKVLTVLTGKLTLLIPGAAGLAIAMEQGVFGLIISSF